MVSLYIQKKEHSFFKAFFALFLKNSFFLFNLILISFIFYSKSYTISFGLPFVF
jgi:hypothetical protein